MKKNGFTLIELMVSISILLVLGTLFIINFTSSGQRRDMNISRTSLVSDLHKIQSLGLSVQDIAPGMPAGAYAILFGAPGSPSYQILGYGNTDLATAIPISTTTFSGSDRIKSITVTTAANVTYQVSSLQVTFRVPYSRLLMTYSNATVNVHNEANDQATITLVSGDGTLMSSVVVDGISETISAQ